MTWTDYQWLYVANYPRSGSLATLASVKNSRKCRKSLQIKCEEKIAQVLTKTKRNGWDHKEKKYYSMNATFFLGTSARINICSYSKCFTSYL